MKQAAFEERYAAHWQQMAEALEALESRKQKPEPQALRGFVDNYRSLVRQHALAVDRCYSAGLIARLQTLLARSHRQLYRRRELLLQQILFFIAVGFPSAVRRHARLFWLSTALFYVPAMVLGVWCYVQSDAIYHVLDPAQVAQMEYAYDPDNDHLGRSEERQSDTDFQMFGFYIYNNTSIGFRTYASGALFGVGSVFFSVFNGVVIGAVAGHLSGLGYQETFWSFVAGHGAFELTAITISATGGLVLGASLLFPGRRRRLDALRQAAAESLPLIVGAAIFFFIAAFIEAFWSSSALPSSIKYAVAAGLWLMVIAYLALAGRNLEDQDAA